MLPPCCAAKFKRTPLDRLARCRAASRVRSFAALIQRAHLLEIEVALEIAEDLVPDQPATAEPDDLRPAGGYGAAARATHYPSAWCKQGEAKTITNGYVRPAAHGIREIIIEGGIYA